MFLGLFVLLLVGSGADTNWSSTTRFQLCRALQRLFAGPCGAQEDGFGGTGEPPKHPHNFQKQSPTTSKKPSPKPSPQVLPNPNEAPGTLKTLLLGALQGPKCCSRVLQGHQHEKASQSSKTKQTQTEQGDLTSRSPHSKHLQTTTTKHPKTTKHHPPKSKGRLCKQKHNTCRAIQVLLRARSSTQTYNHTEFQTCLSAREIAYRRLSDKNLNTTAWPMQTPAFGRSRRQKTHTIIIVPRRRCQRTLEPADPHISIPFAKHFRCRDRRRALVAFGGGAVHSDSDVWAIRIAS